MSEDSRPTRPSRALRLLAVDDEPPALAELVWLLQHDLHVAQVLTAASAADTLRLLEDETFDAVFLDVRMPGLNGLDVARLLSRFHTRPSVVFVTAHDDFAVEAFSLAAVDYLLKPVDPARLAEAVRRVVAAQPGSGGPDPDAAPDLGAGPDLAVLVELAGVTQVVRRSDVLWVEAHGDYARLHTSSQHHHLLRVPLATLEQEWAGAGFVRIHRSLLVSLPRIEELRVSSGRTTVRLGGAVLTVSRRHARTLRDLLEHPPQLGRP